MTVPPSRSSLRRLVRRGFLLALFSGVFAALPLQAQDPRPLELPVAPDTTILYEITLTDGTRIHGHILAVGNGRVTVRTLGGVELDLRRGDIASVTRARGEIVGEELWPEDPSDSRLFIGPTARVPGNGHGYFGVYELFFASGGIGVGDMGMISGGVSLFPGVSLDEQVFYVAPKVRVVNLPSVQLAAGAFWVKPLTDSESAGLVFGGITAGNERAAFSGLLGVPFASSVGFADEQLAMLGGELRLSRRIKLMSENWIVPGEDGAVVSLGVRIIFENATLEVAAATASDSDVVLPVVSFSLTW